tara:strand:- start:2922 stop:4595 length:1674 start_codon:yes stop_codon:yes gene_type:complete
MNVIISKSTVKKIFSKNNIKIFNNEIYWLKKLRKFDFVPKIVNIDYINSSILISNEGQIISNKNKPKNWKTQLKRILNILKKNNCFHSDIKQENLLVKKNKLILIDFAQSTKISDLKKNIFKKNRIFFDQYSINRINLSINKNSIHSNDLRVMMIWKSNHYLKIEKKIQKNKNIQILDKIKIKKNFFKNFSKDRIYWLDQFYNKDIGKDTDKLKDNIFVYIIQSINPVFKKNHMIFENQERIVDDKIFNFKKKIRNNRNSLVHISDNFEEAKRNAIFLSQSKNDFPAKYFQNTQINFKDKKDFFTKLNKTKNLKYVILRNQKSEYDDIDILVNNYFLFKKVSDCHSYKNKNLKLISNSGDPLEENGFKVANYIKINNKFIYLDIRFVGDGYFDTKWQKKILDTRVINSIYFAPNKENHIYALIYHIVYHKGYLNKKYSNYLKKNLKFKKIDIKKLAKIINNYLSKKKYNVVRPSDLTIPYTIKFTPCLFRKEMHLIKNQIKCRNFSGANRMIYNIIKYQNFSNFLKLNFLLLICDNQFKLIKAKFKKILFRYLSLRK